MNKTIIRKIFDSKAWENIQRSIYKFSKNRLSIIGLIVVFIILFLAIFAPYITSHPEAVGKYVNFSDAKNPPSTIYPFGTDIYGRDILTRTIFGFRISIISALIVLLISVPIGIILGLLAGYFGGWLDLLIMRITDIFLSIPVLILALALCSILPRNLITTIIGVSSLWWTWYCRIVYGLVKSIRNEYYIQAAETIGASNSHIIFKEILPNCLGVIITKMTLDMGNVILLLSSLSFVGLGVQPPTAELASMIASSVVYLPEMWWMVVFPSVALVFIVLGFNLLGDGIGDMFSVERG